MTEASTPHGTGAILGPSMPRRALPGLLPAIFASTLVREAVRAGASRAELLAASGLDEATIADPERRLPVAAIYATWAAAMRRVRDDGLPVTVARQFALEHYPILGFAAMTAPSLRVALGQARVGTPGSTP